MVLKPALQELYPTSRVFAGMARGWHRPRVPVRVSKPEKLWIAFRYGLLG